MGRLPSGARESGRVRGGATIRAWVDFWDRREPPTVLALTRILIGAAVLADLLAARSLGLVEAIWAPPPEGFG